MLRQPPFAYTLALFRDGKLQAVEPVPESLVKRICRAAQFQAVRHGGLPVGIPNRRAGEDAAAFFSQALDVVVEANRTTYTRELDLNVLVPWVQPIALALSVTGGEGGEGSFRFRGRRANPRTGSCPQRIRRLAHETAARNPHRG